MIGKLIDSKNVVTITELKEAIVLMPIQGTPMLLAKDLQTLREWTSDNEENTCDL